MANDPKADAKNDAEKEKLQEVYDASMAIYNASIAEQQAAFKYAKANGDIAAQVQASQMIAGLNTDVAAYQNLAAGEFQKLNRGDPNLSREENLLRAVKNNLTAAEIDAAIATHSGGTEEKRIEDYAKGKIRVAQARRGGYRDEADQHGAR